MDKCSLDYKEFLNNKPTVDLFMSAFIHKNDLFGVVEETRDDRKCPTAEEMKEMLERERRMSVVMSDLNDSVFV